MMPLSTAVLDAIKSKNYKLKPVKWLGKERKKVKDGFNLEMAEILARRISMGYTEENQNAEQESMVSYRSNCTVYI